MGKYFRDKCLVGIDPDQYLQGFKCICQPIECLGYQNALLSWRGVKISYR